MPDMKVIRVCTIYVTHYLRKISLWRFQEKMIVVVHQAKRMNHCSIMGFWA